MRNMFISIQAQLALLIFMMFPKEKQLEYDNKLNHWQIPLPLLPAMIFYCLVGIRLKIEMSRPIHDYMIIKYGRKEILRYHNVRSKTKGDMTNDEFNEWWKKNFDLFDVL